MTDLKKGRNKKMDKDLLIRLARAYILYAYRNSDVSKEYWERQLKDLEKIDIIIIQKDEKEE